MFKKIFVSVCSIVTVALCSLGLVGCGAKGSGVEEIEQNNFDIVVSEENALPEGGELSMLPAGVYLSSEASTVSEDGSVKKTINATVLPSDAANKACDWYITWVTTPETEADIGDYFTLEISNNVNASYCTVTCTKAFLGGEALLTCRTQDGGFTATCKVLYEGAPSSFVVTYNGTEVNAQNDVDLPTGKSYTFNLNLSNALGAVSDKYGTFEVTSAEMYGQFNISMANYIMPGTQSGNSVVYLYSLTQKSFVLSDVESAYGSIMGDIVLSDFMTYSISGNVLTITVNSAVESFYRAPQTTDASKPYGYVFSFDSVDSSNPTYARFTVKETVSGKTASFDVNPVTGVSSVSIDSSEITF